MNYLGAFRRLNYENKSNKKYHAAQLVVAGLFKGTCRRDLTSLTV
jgi:hypothetical protein